MRLIDADTLHAQMIADAEQMDEFVAKMFTYAAANEVRHAPTVDAVPVRHGKWLDREVVDDRKDAKIQQWQQARCSCCNKWHTTPYMYYFENYDYCPHCGARMDAERKEE